MRNYRYIGTKWGIWQDLSIFTKVRYEAEYYYGDASEGYSTVYGFIDENGRIICDGVYDEVFYLAMMKQVFTYVLKTLFKHICKLWVFVISLAGDYLQEYEEVLFFQDWRMIICLL